MHLPEYTPVFINGLSTAVPPYELPQDLALSTARKVLGPKYVQFERLASTFKTSGVETRYTVASIEWFESLHNWPERNSLYLEGATKLFVEAARKAMEDAHLKPADIDVLVTVSSTGIATPTLEALAWKTLGFRDDIHRVPVFGLGCAGGVSGLNIASDLARARPNANVLMVTVETCSLSFRSDRLQKTDIIATVLFGDGAAAACISTQQTNVDRDAKLGLGQQVIWPDTLQIMGWDVDENGLGVIFDRSIPNFASEHFAKATTDALERSNLSIEQIDRFVCHPGGAKVVEAIEGALNLKPSSLDAERETLRDFGNMSAPTALFVLKNVLDKGAKGQFYMTALGPGFTASFAPLKVRN